MTHQHQPRWTSDDRLDLLDPDDGSLCGCICAAGPVASGLGLVQQWEWTCQRCERQDLVAGPDPAHAWSAFLKHEQTVHLSPPECETCATPIVQPTTGRPRRYCSDACRQMAHRDRQP